MPSFYYIYIVLTLYYCISHFLVCFSIIHCDANCFNPAVSAGLFCTNVYMIYCLVISFRGPQYIVILANRATLYKIV